MRNFTSVTDVENITELVDNAVFYKKYPLADRSLGDGLTLGLIFLNPSLRTRLSTQKAARNLGMDVMVMNLDKEGWAIETRDGVLMNGSKAEHIREAAGILGGYCDILGIRCFPGLEDRHADYSEELLTKFIRYAGVPVVSLESATRHPLQSLADLVTIRENHKNLLNKKPKVVLTWAPHIKPLPQAVPNSFSEWMCRAEVDFVITHPEGYDLADQFTKGAKICYNQDEALEGADFVYVKNWSSYEDYGKMPGVKNNWLLTENRLPASAHVMHCLPVRRGVELSDGVIDGPQSIILEQGYNRVCAAQSVLKKLITDNINTNGEAVYSQDWREHY